MKQLLTILMLLVFSQLTTAQVKFGAGIKAGLGANSMFDKINGESVQDFYDDVYQDTDIKARVFNLGFLSGVFAELDITESVSIQSELLFSGEGTGVKFFDDDDNSSYEDGDFDYTERFKMTNIPVFLKIGIGEIDAYGGIQFSSVREIGRFTGTRSSDNKPEEISDEEYDNYKENWTSFVGGVSAEQNGFIVDLRLTIGPEIRKDPDAPDAFGNTFSQSPASLQLSIGYKLFGK